MKNIARYLIIVLICIFSISVSAQDNEHILSLAWSPIGNLLAIGTGTDVQVFDMTEDTPVFQWAMHTGQPVNTLLFSPSGEWLASGQGSGTFEHDGRVTVWASDTGTVVADFVANQTAIHVLAFSPEGQYLATGGGYFPTRAGFDYRVRQWDTTTWEVMPEKDLDGRGLVTAIAFTSDNNMLIYSSLHTPVNIVDTQTTNIIAAVHEEGAECVHVDDEQNRLILGFYRSLQVWAFHNEPEFHLTRQVIWETEYSENLVELFASEYVIGCDSEYFITSADDSSLRIRDVNTAEVMFSYHTPERYFTYATLNPNTEQLAFISDASTNPLAGDYESNYQVGVWQLGADAPTVIELN